MVKLVNNYVAIKNVPPVNPPEPKYYVYMPRDDDGIVVFDEHIKEGEFIFNIRLQENNGFYFNLGTTGFPSNWGWVLHATFINSTYLTAGFNVDNTDIYITRNFNSNLDLNYKLTFYKNNEQRHFINNELIGTSNLNLGTGIKGLNFYSAFSYNNNYFNYNIQNYEFKNLELIKSYNFNANDWSHFYDKSIESISNFPILQWAEGSLKNTKIIDEDNLLGPYEIDLDELINKQKYVKVAVHIIAKYSEDIPYDANKQVEQMIINLNIGFEKTYESMKPDGNIYFTPGNKKMNFNFELYKNADTPDLNYYIIDSSMEYYSEYWRNGYNIVFSDGPGDWGSDIICTDHYGISYENNICNIFIGIVNNDYEIVNASAYAYLGQYVAGTKYHIIWGQYWALPSFSDSKNNIFAHEMGHWLGLLHPFPDGAFEIGDGDGIADTPYTEALRFRPSYLDSDGNPWPKNSLNIPDSDPADPGRDPIYNTMGFAIVGGQFYSRFTDYQLYVMATVVENYLTNLYNNENSKRDIQKINNITQKLDIEKLYNKKVLYKSKVTNFMCSHGGFCGCKMPISLNVNTSDKLIKSYIQKEKIMFKKVSDHIKNKNKK